MKKIEAQQSTGNALRKDLFLDLRSHRLKNRKLAKCSRQHTGPLSAGCAHPSPITKLRKRTLSGFGFAAGSDNEFDAKREYMEDKLHYISCSDLVTIIEKSQLTNTHDDPLILDIRGLHAQTCLVIKNAIGMPCESRMKLQFALPILLDYMQQLTTMSGNPETDPGRLIIIYTECSGDTQSSNSLLIEKLVNYLKLHIRATVRILQGGFREFRKSYPHFCVRPSQFIWSADGDKTICKDLELRNQDIFDSHKSPTLSPRSQQLIIPTLSLPCLYCTNLSSPHSSRESSGTNKFEPSTPSSTSQQDWFRFSQPSCRSSDILCAKISQILPFLYIGNEIDARALDVLGANSIESLLNVTQHVPFVDETLFQCHRISAMDVETEDLRSLFEQAFDVIEKSRISGRNVLVYCQAGVSRSPALVVAYLLAHSSLSLRDAYHLVKSKRPIISPNLGFLGQLSEFENDLKSGRCERKSNILDEQIIQHAGSTTDYDSFSKNCSGDSTDF